MKSGLDAMPLFLLDDLLNEKKILQFLKKKINFESRIFFDKLSFIAFTKYNNFFWISGFLAKNLEFLKTIFEIPQPNWPGCSFFQCLARPGPFHEQTEHVPHCGNGCTRLWSFCKCVALALRVGKGFIHFWHVNLWVKSLNSEATPLATPFFKRTYKISHPPWL